MCDGKPEVDTSVQDQMNKDARIARQQEEKRQHRIERGQMRLDNKFGKFDDAFFEGYQQDYLDLYQPDLDQQFGDAQDELTYALARAGTLNSSVAGEKSADLTKAYNDQTASLVSQATDATNQLRGQVSTEKSDLISLLNATGDASRAANEATSRSAVLFQAQPTYNPTPGLFAGLAGGVGNYMAGQQSAALRDAYFGAPSARGSSDYRVVG